MDVCVRTHTHAPHAWPSLQMFTAPRKGCAAGRPSAPWLWPCVLQPGALGFKAVGLGFSAGSPEADDTGSDPSAAARCVPRARYVTPRLG